MENKITFKKTFKIIFNIFLTLLGLFCLIGSIVLFTVTSVEYDNVTSTYYETNDIGGGIFFGIIALVCLFFPIKLMIKTIKNKNRIAKEKEQKLKEYEESRGITKISNNVSIIEKEKIIILNQNEYQFKNIMGCELIEDGNSITSITGKKKASLGKALVGGALFGGAGAIIGGTSGKTRSTAIETNYCTNLKIKITINNLQTPCEFIDIINRRTDRQSTKYKQSYEDAQKILSVIDIICKNNNAEE